MLIITRNSLHEVFQSGERTEASFTTGRTKIPDEVFSSAERATASWPKYNFTIRAKENYPLEFVGSTIETRSPVFKNRSCQVDHFDRRFKVLMYSFSHLLQIA